MTKQQITIDVDVPEAWQWPSWLIATWLAMDANEVWCGYEEEPVIDGAAWWWSEANFQEIDNGIIAFTPPPCTDWRQSKRRRPM